MLPIKQGQVAIGLVCVVLGIMLAVQFHTTQDVRSTIPFQRIEDLSQRLQQTEKERDALLKQIRELRKTSGVENATQEIESAAAESRIRDVDVASEASKLISTQIRQQLATKILQSANLQPKIALDLLRN